jgi:hypothetical protein
VPRLVSDLPLSAASRGALFEGREPLLACLYLGLAPLVLSALGLRRRLAAPVGAGLLFFVVAALGRHTPAYGLLLALPGFGLMRYPQKFLLPAALCGALLAAAGAEAWTRPWSVPDRRWGRAVTLLLLLAAALALAGAWWVVGPADGLGRFLESGGDGALPALVRRAAALKLARAALLAVGLALPLWRRAAREQAGRATTAALLVLGGLDLVLVGRGTNPLAPPQLLDRRPALVGLLEPETTRLHAATEKPECLAAGEGPRGWLPSWVVALAFQETLRPPSGARWRLRGSYDGEFTGLGSRWSAPFTSAAWGLLGTPAGLRLLQVGGVSHVLRLGESPVPGLDLLQIRSSPYACPLQVLRVPDPLPETYVVHGERSGSDAEAALRILLDPAFDPRREVVVAEARPAVAPSATSTDDARVVSRRLDSLELEARLSAPGVVVLLEAFEPGWRATVDGVPAPLLRANGLFQAVRLGEGRHHVRLAYRPRSVAWGAWLSALGLAGAVGLGLMVRRGRAGLMEVPAGRSIGAGSAS